MPDDRPTQSPHIRGQERADLVDDLAQGDQTHEQLAEKYGGRHVQANPLGGKVCLESRLVVEPRKRKHCRPALEAVSG